jgi:hypothetical protein
VNNLDPAVAEDAESLVVYGGRGKAARSPEALAGIVAALERLGADHPFGGSAGARRKGHFPLSSGLVVHPWKRAGAER